MYFRSEIRFMGVIQFKTNHKTNLRTKIQKINQLKCALPSLSRSTGDFSLNPRGSCIMRYGSTRCATWFPALKWLGGER